MDKTLRMTKEELTEIKTLYENIMSTASHGLFFRSGLIMGKRIAQEALKNRAKYFEVCAIFLKDNGWLESITFNENNVLVKDSIENRDDGNPSCHMLRGVLARLYEEYQGKKIYCREIKCQGKGNNLCEFQIEGGL